jgi:hypothetical protein
MRLLLTSLFAIAAWAVSPAHASTFNDADVRKQLDRLMFPEQYLLDVTVVPIAVSNVPAPNERPLPGLPFFGNSAGDAAAMGLPNNGPGNADGLSDVLLVIDIGVSDERARLAEEVVRRYADAAGVKSKMRLTVRRDPILKVAPPELAPLPERRIDPKAPGQAAAEQAPTPPNIYDFIENKRDLATRTLLVLWTALASLVGVFALMSRRGKQNGDARAPLGKLAGEGKSKSAKAAAGDNGRKALTKDEIYSQDAALHKLAQEIVSEAAKQPAKVAGVLGRWIGDSVENAKYANLFLRNCDIATVESICRHLHPSDVDKLVEHGVDDFDPFGAENKKVLDLMRTELARLAARNVFSQRAEPLAFLKTVSDHDLAKILADESLRDLAMVATQLPMHRLQAFFDHQPEEKLQAMMSEVVHLEDVRQEELDAMAERFKLRIKALGQVVVDDAAVDEAARQVVSVTRDPRRQVRLAATLQRQSIEVFRKARPEILLVADLRHFGPRPSKVIFQTIDGEQFGMAMAGLSGDTPEWLQSLPEAFAASYQQARGREHETKDREAAWQRIQRVVADLVGSGLITTAEMNQAKQQTDLWLLLVLGDADPEAAHERGDVQGAA